MFNRVLITPQTSYQVRDFLQFQNAASYMNGFFQYNIFFDFKQTKGLKQWLFIMLLPFEPVSFMFRILCILLQEV